MISEVIADSIYQVFEQSVSHAIRIYGTACIGYLCWYVYYE